MKKVTNDIVPVPLDSLVGETIVAVEGEATLELDLSVEGFDTQLNEWVHYEKKPQPVYTNSLKLTLSSGRTIYINDVTWEYGEKSGLCVTASDLNDIGLV